MNPNKSNIRNTVNEIVKCLQHRTIAPDGDDNLRRFCIQLEPFFLRQRMKLLTEINR
ncbi:hypothetical protein D3C74_417220 [compost metagenome]